MRFETEGGLALLCEPSPLDRWIDRKIYHDRRARKYFYRTTGDELTEEDTKDYKSYIQRHNGRRDTARRAGGAEDLCGEAPVESCSAPSRSQEGL